MPSKLTIPVSVVGLAAFVWLCAGFAQSKADKSETEKIKERVAELEKAKELSNQKQDWMLQGIEKVDKKLDFLIEKLLTNGPASRPPANSTPNPLNQRDDR